MNKVSEIIELPSLGRYYGTENAWSGPALPGGKLEITPMGTDEEALLISRKNRSDAHEALDIILKRCIKTEYPLENLLVSDRFFILLVIRNLSYGSDYTYKVECPDCGLEFQYTIKIPGGLKIRIPDDTDKEPFNITLPKSGKKVAFKLLRHKDEKGVQDYARGEYRKSVIDSDPSYKYRLSKYIVSIDGEYIYEDSSKKMSFISSLVGQDSAYLKKAISVKDCGVNLDVSPVCGQCGKRIESILQFTAEFFCPDTPEIRID